MISVVNKLALRAQTVNFLILNERLAQHCPFPTSYIGSLLSSSWASWVAVCILNLLQWPPCSQIQGSHVSALIWYSFHFFLLRTCSSPYFCDPHSPGFSPLLRLGASLLDLWGLKSSRALSYPQSQFCGIITFMLMPILIFLVLIFSLSLRLVRLTAYSTASSERETRHGHTGAFGALPPHPPLNLILLQAVLLSIWHNLLKPKIQKSSLILSITTLPFFLQFCQH